MRDAAGQAAIGAPEAAGTRQEATLQFGQAELRMWRADNQMRVQREFAAAATARVALARALLPAPGALRRIA